MRDTIWLARTVDGKNSGLENTRRGNVDQVLK